MNTESIRDEIRGIFVSEGGMSTRSLAKTCIDRGVFPDEWEDRALLKIAQSEVRKALKDCGIDGLPFAGKSSSRDDDGAPVWVQREMWDYETYALNITQYQDQRDANHHRLAGLHKECLVKFCRAPAIDGLPPIRSIKGEAA